MNFEFCVEIIGAIAQSQMKPFAKSVNEMYWRIIIFAW